jgi:hypothetical protein
MSEAEKALAAIERETLVARVAERIDLYRLLKGSEKAREKALKAPGFIETPALVREIYEDMYGLLGGDRDGEDWNFILLYNGDSTYVYATRHEISTDLPGNFVRHVDFELGWGIIGPPEEKEGVTSAADDLVTLFAFDKALPKLDWSDEEMFEALWQADWKHRVKNFGSGVIGQAGIDQITIFVRLRGGDARQASRMVGRISMWLGEEPTPAETNAP